MKIGIDISQIAYGTGVGNYLQNLVEHLITYDKKNTYILFFSSLRGVLPNQFVEHVSQQKHATIIQAPLPPKLLDVLWNRMHIFPIEQFIGNVDLFITSDWTEPPARYAKKATILYDLIVYKFPEETATIIENTQKRKLAWVKKESDMIFCISDATRKDAEKILGIPKAKLAVIYPGLTL